LAFSPFLFQLGSDGGAVADLAHAGWTV
jgi:hypothetical protein